MDALQQAHTEALAAVSLLAFRLYEAGKDSETRWTEKAEEALERIDVPER